MSLNNDLIVTARSGPALEKVAQSLAQKHGVKATAIACDLGEIGAGAKLAAAIAAQGLKVDVLVNNAGFGHAGAFADEPAEPQLGMLDLNVRALTELTHIYWKGMLAAGKGGVLNVGSTAAFQPGPFMAVYYASKAYVLSFSEALWEEARGTGVHVSCLCPGPTESKFRERSGTGRTRLAQAGKAMTSASVARLGYRAFQANQRVIITGLRNRILRRATGAMPRGQVLKIVRGLMQPV